MHRKRSSFHSLLLPLQQLDDVPFGIGSVDEADATDAFNAAGYDFPECLSDTFENESQSTVHVVYFKGKMGKSFSIGGRSRFGKVLIVLEDSEYRAVFPNAPPDQVRPAT